MSDSKTYDVFLSYNSADANLVDTIALKLKEKGITIFLTAGTWYQALPGRNIWNKCSTHVMPWPFY